MFHCIKETVKAEKKSMKNHCIVLAFGKIIQEILKIESQKQSCGTYKMGRLKIFIEFIKKLKSVHVIYFFCIVQTSLSMSVLLNII